MFRSAKGMAHTVLGRLGWEVRRYPVEETQPIKSYQEGGRIPWSAGYTQARDLFIEGVLSDQAQMECFRTHGRLPIDYGVGLDERCVEYPWLFANLPPTSKKVLDAGSTLNYAHLLDHLLLPNTKLHIVTLFPEADCHWQRGVSYLYDDLRKIPIKSDYYDSVVCISTLEHIGFDNSIYTQDFTFQEHAEEDYVLALREMRRVLSSEGTLLLTVPFGKRQDLGWSRQFDHNMLQQAIDAFALGDDELQVTYFRYSERGWQASSAQECADCTYVQWIADAWLDGEWPDPIPVESDLAAAARAVACIRVKKARQA